MRRLVYLTVFLFVAVPAVAADRQAKPAPAGPVKDVLECRSVADNAARLACYDRGVDRLAGSVARRDVVVVDREEVRQARRSLFGFALPSLKIFGGDDEKNSPEAASITATIAAARLDADSRWIIELTDGAVWHQIDSRDLVFSPRSGTGVTIRHAALGSYIMRVGDRPGFKVRRDR